VINLLVRRGRLNDPKEGLGRTDRVGRRLSGAITRNRRTEIAPVRKVGGLLNLVSPARS